MRVVAIVALAACHPARPAEAPRAATTLAQAPSEDDDLGVAFSGAFSGENQIAKPPAFLCSYESDSGIDCYDQFFEPVESPTSPTPGRYYIDGIYVESRGPSSSLWHGFGGR